MGPPHCHMTQQILMCRVPNIALKTNKCSVGTKKTTVEWLTMESRNGYCSVTLVYLKVSGNNTVVLYQLSCLMHYTCCYCVLVSHFYIYINPYTISYLRYVLSFFMA